MDIIPVVSENISVGQLANAYAASHVFSDYQSKVAANTLKRQRDDIASFSVFLKKLGMDKDNLLFDCAEWHGITYGLIETFKRWQLEQGYAIASINAHLSTIKVYASLAAKAGIISAEEHAMMKMVKSYRHKEGRNVDAKREVTRRGEKKAEAVRLSQQSKPRHSKHSQIRTRDAVMPF